MKGPKPNNKISAVENHSIIKRSPYEALFGHPPQSRLGENVKIEDDVNDPETGM